MEGKELSDRSREILGAIAEGRSYEQILAANRELTYYDIFSAAGEALEIAGKSDSGSTYEQRMAEIRAACPRAYEPWSESEETRLKELHRAGTGASEMARLLQRQPSAIAAGCASSRSSRNDKIEVSAW